VRRYVSAEIDDGVWDDEGDSANNNSMCRSTGGDRGGGADNSNHIYRKVTRGGQTIMVMGDPTRIEQVILNLVKNAIQHTTTGFVKVNIRRAKFSELALPRGSVDAGTSNHECDMDGESGSTQSRQCTACVENRKKLGKASVVIEVRDSGCGILHKDRMHIFDVLCRGNREREGSEPGWINGGGGGGIGLTLCRKLVMAHGSDISVQSVVNLGTVFCFSLARASTKPSIERKPRRWSDHGDPFGADDLPLHAELHPTTHEPEVQAIEETVTPNTPHEPTGDQRSPRQSIARFEKSPRSSHKTTDSWSGIRLLSPRTSSALSPRSSSVLSVTPRSSNSSQSSLPPRVSRTRRHVRRRSFVEVLAAHELEADSEAVSNPGECKRTRVLVVDDNENNLLVVTNMLVPNGFIVETVKSGEECLQFLSARLGAHDAPDVVGGLGQLRNTNLDLCIQL
jgi:hypothetical protein